MDKAEVKKLIERQKALKAKRTVWESHWQELSEFVAPRQNDFKGQNTPGEKKRNRYTNGRPEYFVSVLAATFGSLLSNPATQWFKLNLRGYDVNQNIEAKRWMDEVEQKVVSVFTNSNFTQEVDRVYQDLAVFGTALLYCEEDDDEFVRFSARSVSECLIDVNDKGDVDTVFRIFMMPLRQIAQKFGFENLSDDMKKQTNKNPDKEYRVIHACYPRFYFDPNKTDSKNMPWVSCWLTEEGTCLKESGYNEFPWAIPRFRVFTGEMYGRSQAMIALPNIKHVAIVEKTAIKARELDTMPPMVVEGDAMLSPFVLAPGSVLRVRRMNQRPQPLVTNVNPRSADIQVEYKLNEIKEAFYYDIIMTQDGPQKTATEIIQRSDERSRVLTNALSRIQRELFQPLIGRVLAILARKGEFPEPPEVIVEQLRKNKRKIDIIYTSPLANASIGHKAHSIVRYVEAMAPLAQAIAMGSPVFDRLNIMEATKVVADGFGVPASVLVSDREIMEKQEAAAQAAQAQAEAQSLMQMSEGVKNIAKAEKDAAGGQGPASAILKQLGDQVQ